MREETLEVISYSLVVMPTQLATESPTKMTSRRALEWMGMFNGLTGFRYEISDLLVCYLTSVFILLMVLLSSSCKTSKIPLVYLQVEYCRKVLL